MGRFVDITEKIHHSNIRIAVLGDLMLDHYIFGHVHRISPEAPVPIVERRFEKNNVGGAGNAIMNISSLGIKAIPVGVVGNDYVGKILIKLLLENEIDIDHIVFSTDLSTTHKTRIIADNQQIVRVDWDNQRIDNESIVKIRCIVDKLVNTVDAIIISDYGKGVCDEATLIKTIKLYKKKGIKIFVDPKGRDFTKYTGAYCITPNTKEAQEVLPFKLEELDDFYKGCDLIMERYNIDCCIITRGEKGIISSNGENKYNIPAIAKEVFDVSGAGDTMVASFAAAVTAGVKFDISLEFANAAAGVVIGHVGTVPINIKELHTI